MQRTPLIAANWKMHKTVPEALTLAKSLLPDLEELSGVDSLLCPPATALMPLSALLDGSSVALGAQNLYWEAEGAYTGELSPSMVAEFCSYVIIGHSERRSLFGEDDQDAQRKVRAALEAGLVPILCVGESLEENEAGRAAEVLAGQLRGALDGITVSSPAALVLAYEPVWAIGTGKAATPEDTNVLLRNVVRPALSSLLGAEVAAGMRVLYGGSVKADNARAFFEQPEIDGALVGGASLQAESFAGIARAAQ